MVVVIGDFVVYARAMIKTMRNAGTTIGGTNKLLAVSLSNRAVFAAILKEAAARQSPEHGDRGRKPRRMHLLLDPLAAFGAEALTDGLAVDRDVRLEQRRRAARAAQPRILLAARTYGAARDEIAAASVKARVGSVAPR